MPIEPTKSIWMNGEMIPWGDAQIHVLTHTLHYGTGVFEGIRAYETDKGTCIFRLEDHVQRLFNIRWLGEATFNQQFADLFGSH